MKIPNRIKFIFYDILLMSAIYLFFSGVSWDFDISQWGKITRFLFMTSEAFVMYFIIMELISLFNKE